MRGMSRRRHQANASQTPSASSAVPIPTIASKERWSRVLAGGRSLAGIESRPVTLVPVLKPTRKESRPGMRDRPLHPVRACRCRRRTRSGGRRLRSMHSKPANLAGWWWATARAASVADEELDRGGDQRDRQRDQQPQPVQPVAPPAQHPDRIDRGDQEAGDHVGGEDHVRHLVAPGAGLKSTLRGSVSTTLAARAEREALRLVHPGVGGDHREGAADPRRRPSACPDQKCAQPLSRLQP